MPVRVSPAMSGLELLYPLVEHVGHVDEALMEGSRWDQPHGAPVVRSRIRYRNEMLIARKVRGIADGGSATGYPVPL